MTEIVSTYQSESKAKSNQPLNIVDFDFEQKLNLALAEVQIKIEQLSDCMHPVNRDNIQAKLLIEKIQCILSNLLDDDTVRDALWLSPIWRRIFDFAETHPDLYEPILPLFWQLQPTLQLEELCANGYHPTAACNFSQNLAIEQLKVIFERNLQFSPSSLSMGALCSILSQRPEQMMQYLNYMAHHQSPLFKGNFLVLSTNSLPPIVTDVDCFIRHTNTFDVPLAIIKLNNEQSLDLFTISLLSASTECAKILKSRFHSYPTEDQIITLLEALLPNTPWDIATQETFKQKVLDCYQQVFP